MLFLAGIMMQRFVLQIVLILACIGFVDAVSAQSVPSPFYSAESKQWADSVYNSLNQRQRIGQLFMVSAWSNKDSAHIRSIDSLILNYNLGGICFFQGGPVRQAILTNRYQGEAKVPLLISIDGEWGLSMRLDSTLRFPRQMTLGATPDKVDIYKMGAEIARQCKLIGIHVNFAPCIDINNNPLNPVINSRSFGENKIDVAQKGMLYMKGMQDNNVLACGKHFPGHGNTESDSHFTLPVINQPAAELDSVEFFPFKTLINAGLGSVMVAHLNIPALDSTPGLATTLSPVIIKDILKTKLNFKGIVFTDALNMKGVADFNKPGELELAALKAGNDILLCTEAMPLAVELIDSALINGTYDSIQFYESVIRVLQLKYWCGLNKNTPLDLDKINNELQNDDAGYLNYKLYKDAITLLKNRHHTLPLYSFKESRIASLVINDSLNNVFQNRLNKYADVDVYRMSKEPTQSEFDSLMNVLCDYESVILSIHNTSTKSNINFNITEKMDQAIDYLHNQTQLTTVVFGNAYSLGKLPHLPESDAVIISYEDTRLPAENTAQLIFGAYKPTGKIPVAPSAEIELYSGINQMENTSVIKYSMPEEFGIKTKSFSKIDSIANYAIASGATPGCQFAVSYKGSLIYNKSFGNCTYTDSVKVNNDNLYDIASVTKIASTALAVMYLYDKGKIDPDKKISRYLPELKNSNKKDLVLRDIMTHQAGLKAWIPFYKQTIDSAGRVDTTLYRNVKDSTYCIEVADSFYLRKDYAAKIKQQIIDSPVEPTGKYVYSDLGIILMQLVVEQITKMPVDSFVEETFYKPMALKRLTYKPLEKFNTTEIVPTEFDSEWRHQLVQGHVHDMAAAMMGGVAGHAGLFSNAESLTILMQMLLQKGFYGGKQFIKKETIELFTKQFYQNTENRRGLFFDKPEPDKTKNGPTAKSASPSTFGHTGFTGTCAWVDPANELVFVFLSNRVYPSSTNNKLANLNIRTDMMQVVYDAIAK